MPSRCWEIRRGGGICFCLFVCFKVSLDDFVHPIDYSGGAVLVRLSGGHLFPKRGFQSQLLLEALVIHRSEGLLLLLTRIIN